VAAAVAEGFGTDAAAGALDEGRLDIAEAVGRFRGEVVIADAFEGREAEESLAIGVEESGVCVPVSGVVGDIDEVAEDEDGAGCGDGAAGREGLAGELIDGVDGCFGACGAPFIEVDLGVGGYEEPDFVIGGCCWGGGAEGAREGEGGSCERAGERAAGD